MLLTHRKYNAPKVMKNDWQACGYNTHINMANVRPKIGAPWNKYLLDLVGVDCSFVNNLIASAKGTGIPMRLGLLGPFRV